MQQPLEVAEVGFANCDCIRVKGAQLDLEPPDLLERANLHVFVATGQSLEDTAEPARQLGGRRGLGGLSTVAFRLQREELEPALAARGAPDLLE